MEDKEEYQTLYYTFKYSDGEREMSPRNGLGLSAMIDFLKSLKSDLKDEAVTISGVEQGSYRVAVTVPKQKSQTLGKLFENRTGTTFRHLKSLLDDGIETEVSTLNDAGEESVVFTFEPSVFTLDDFTPMYIHKLIKHQGKIILSDEVNGKHIKLSRFPAKISIEDDATAQELKKLYSQDRRIVAHLKVKKSLNKNKILSATLLSFEPVEQTGLDAMLEKLTTQFTDYYRPDPS